MKNLIKTKEVVKVENYPYSFNLKTTLINSMEFNPKKGYRHVTQTVNPKTGRLNSPKKSTYNTLKVRYFDEKGHVQCMGFDFNGDKELNRACKFISENFNLFTPAEISYLYNTAFFMAFADLKATVIYGGSSLEDLKPLYRPFIDACKEGLKTGENLFNRLILDCEAIEATKPKDYNPFKITYSGPIVLD